MIPQILPSFGVDNTGAQWYNSFVHKLTTILVRNSMRVTALLLIAAGVFLTGCATTSDTDGVDKDDLKVFSKIFEGTVLHKKIEEFDREEPVRDMPFWSYVVSGVYLEFRVLGPDGAQRDFFDYSEEPERMRVLKQYYREIMKDDLVVVHLGFVDGGSAKEQFESVTVKTPRSSSLK